VVVGEDSESNCKTNYDDYFSIMQKQTTTNNQQRKNKQPQQEEKRNICHYPLIVIHQFC